MLGAAFGGFGMDSLSHNLARFGSENNKPYLELNPARKTYRKFEFTPCPPSSLGYLPISASA